MELPYSLRRHVLPHLVPPPLCQVLPPPPPPPTPPSLSLSASGLDKSPIKAILFFRFSSLLSSLFGFECGACLTKFDDVDFLHLLPKCNHALHIGCINQYLETNCTCPLCCLHGTAADLSSSLRFLHNLPSALDSDLELEAERGGCRGSSRFCIGGSEGHRCWRACHRCTD
ncbi:putative RING-H2 finger protein ATL12 [Salvia splendens]|uniref:putative RING-H2 finger protein ATL12 n=1 Tax=Salvia splendens TaxID=180675 RepID=UPI001C2572E4|nr:putative RING-H2 finger protein ATL12 [Salvia splendens]